MALTLPKWLLVVAIGCAAVWYGLFFQRASKAAPAATQVATSSQPVAASAYAIGGTMSRAADRLRVLKIRDSVLRDVARQPNAGLSVMVSDAYGPENGRALERLLRERWQRLGGSSSVPIVIAAVLDSASTEAGVPRPRPSMMFPISIFLPDVTDRSGCVSIMRIPAPISGRMGASFRRHLLSPETVGALFGPCMYFATFGSPGPEVERWLRGGSWRMAHFTDWTTPPHRWTVPANFYGPRAIERALSIDDRSWRVRLAVATPGLACIAGQPGRCVQAAVSPVKPDADSAWRKRVVASVGSSDLLFYAPHTPLPLGPSDGWILSEMARTLGKEKFSRFWRSADSVPQAFQAAAGQSLDDWIRDWARRMYGPVPTGPSLGTNDALMGLVLAAIGVAGSVAITRRRRVT